MERDDDRSGRHAPPLSLVQQSTYDDDRGGSDVRW
jgi:hypothetical protein